MLCLLFPLTPSQTLSSRCGAGGAEWGSRMRLDGGGAVAHDSSLLGRAMSQG